MIDAGLIGLAHGFSVALEPHNLLWCFVGVLVGNMVGVLPGVGPVAVRAHRQGRELLALTLCGLLAAADAPFAWSHHFVWFAPLVVLLAHHAAAGDRRAQAGLAVLLAGTLAWVTRLPGPGVGPIPSTGLVSLLPDAYLVVVAVVLIVARLTTKGSVPQGAEAPTP